MSEFPYIVIRNVDRQNNKFRPSDWAERMASSAASFEGKRLQFDERVIPCRRCKDLVCLRVNRTIAIDQPHVMETIEEFMRMHQLDDFVSHCPDLAMAYLDWADKSACVQQARMASA